MPIIDLQTRARELGRIRIGQVVSTKNGRTRPSKLDRFRITSPSREILEKIAALYGGQVQEWTPQNSTVGQYEVVTTSTRLPVLVPPQPVSQWYETWSGGGCQRRCDGVREVLSDQPCLCGPDPEARDCKPTTRLNVVLREVEGVGVFRLETKGYYAAVELPSAAELLAASRGYIVGHLGLEERVVKRAGDTRRFMVPTLDVDATPAQLMSGAAGITPAVAATPERTAIDTGRAPAAAIEAAPTSTPPAEQPGGKLPLTAEQEETLLAQIGDTDALDDVRAMWTDLTRRYHLPVDGPVVAALKGRAAELAQPAEQPTTAAGADAAAQQDGGDPDELWAQILRTVPADWPSSRVEQDFANFTSTPAEQAGATDMRAYLNHLRSGGSR